MYRPWLSRSRAEGRNHFHCDGHRRCLYHSDASFVVNGAAQARDSALATASAELNWTNGWSTAATFEGEFSNVSRSNAGRGVVRYSW